MELTITENGSQSPVTIDVTMTPDEYDLLTKSSTRDKLIQYIGSVLSLQIERDSPFKLVATHVYGDESSISMLCEMCHLDWCAIKGTEQWKNFVEYISYVKAIIEKEQD